MRGLEGRLALVTGATGFIGTAITNRLISEGVTVVATSRQIDKVRKHYQNRQDCERIIPLEIDLSCKESISKELDRISEQFGTPSILIANASLREGLEKSFSSLEHSDFSRIFEVDLAGHFFCARQLVEHLPNHETASFVFLSSIYSLAGVDSSIYPKEMSPTPVQYAVTKSAELGLVRHLASLWGKFGIRVNGVVAGGVRSNQRQSEEFVKKYSGKTMLGRMATAEEIASSVAFLASDEASYITGECLAVDGGFLAW